MTLIFYFPLHIVKVLVLLIYLGGYWCHNNNDGSYFRLESDHDEDGKNQLREPKEEEAHGHVEDRLKISIRK